MLAPRRGTILLTGLSAVLLALTPLIALGFTTRTASACSCVQLEGFPDAFDRADAVFLGTVTNADLPYNSTNSTGTPIRVSFAVREVWKGLTEPTAHVVTAAHEVSCGYHFSAGFEYLVFAYTDTVGGLRTGFCSGTAAAGDAADALAGLGPGLRVTMPPAAPPSALSVTAAADDGSGTPAWLPAAGAALIVVLLALSVGAVAATARRR
jgi:hypothetical protein